MKKIHAFTLVELLVVISIIGLLAALLLPALATAKKRAQGATCLSNLKQWGGALHLYTSDNKDFLPPEGKANPLDADLNNPGYQGWYIQLPEVLKIPLYRDMPWRTDPDYNLGNSIWLCPSNPRHCNISDGGNAHNLFHYCLNEYINGTGLANKETVALSSLPSPSSIVYLFDTAQEPGVGTESSIHTNLHDGGAQVLFLDSHVARLKKSDYWSSTGPILNNPAIRWIP